MKILMLGLLIICVCVSHLTCIDGLKLYEFAPSRLCYHYPTDGPPYRYHKESQKCYSVGEKGPCGDLMKFTIQDADFGVCDCDHSRRCGRPLIYYPPKKRCYYVNSQGPCRSGKWFVFGSDLYPVCKRNPCETDEERQPSREGRFWFPYQGKCYRTYTRGYCKNPDEILFNVREHYRPTCQKNPVCSKMQNFQTLACLPGQRLDYYGQCKRALQPLPVQEDTSIGKPTDSGSNAHCTTQAPKEKEKKPDNVYCLFCNRRETVRTRHYE